MEVRNPGFRYSPEIFDDDVQVEGGGGPPVQARIDDPPADFDGGVVAEIVGGFENIQAASSGHLASARPIPHRITLPAALARLCRMQSTFMAECIPVQFQVAHFMHRSAGCRFAPESAPPAFLRD